MRPRPRPTPAVTAPPRQVCRPQGQTEALAATDRYYVLNPRTGSRKSPWKLGGQEPALLPPACSESLVASRAVGGRWGHSTETGLGTDTERQAPRLPRRGTALPVSTPPPPAPLHSVTHDYMTFKAGELCMTSLRGDRDVPRDNPNHRAIRHEPPGSGCWQVNRRARAPGVGSAVARLVPQTCWESGRGHEAAL